MQEIVNYIEVERESRSERSTAAAVNGVNATVFHARDLTLDKFIDHATITNAAKLPRPDGGINTVLLTGATGFLGRYLVLKWLERLAPTGGKLVCLVLVVRVSGDKYSSVHGPGANQVEGLTEPSQVERRSDHRRRVDDAVGERVDHFAEFVVAVGD